MVFLDPHLSQLELNELSDVEIFLKVNLLSTSGPASVGLLYYEVVGTLVTESQFVQAVGLSSVLPVWRSPT